jgi:hypothetical protein
MQSLLITIYMCIIQIKRLRIFLECPSQTFGQNCSEECGQCSGGSTCDHVNGTCANGCADGYVGMYCSISKLEYAVNNILTPTRNRLI